MEQGEEEDFNAEFAGEPQRTLRRVKRGVALRLRSGQAGVRVPPNPVGAVW